MHEKCRVTSTKISVFVLYSPCHLGPGASHFGFPPGTRFSPLGRPHFGFTMSGLRRVLEKGVSKSEERDDRFWPFCRGAVTYAVLLLSFL